MPNLLVGFLPPVQTPLQMTLRRMSRSHEEFEESSESLDSELVSSSHELIGRFLIFYRISGTKVPACVGENSGIPV